jgi:energy-coupling factor transport system substrate-specific component
MKPMSNKKRYAIIMAISVIMNEALYEVCLIYKLPCWLDTSGTALASLVLEPTAGLLVGLINNFYLAISSGDPQRLLYYAASASVALVVGNTLRNAAGQVDWHRLKVTIPLLILIPNFFIIVLMFLMDGGQVFGDYAVIFDNMALSWGWSPALSAIFGTLADKTMDVFAVVGVMALVYRILPPVLKYSPSELSDVEKAAPPEKK